MGWTVNVTAVVRQYLSIKASILGRNKTPGNLQFCFVVCISKNSLPGRTRQIWRGFQRLHISWGNGCTGDQNLGSDGVHHSMTPTPACCSGTCLWKCFATPKSLSSLEWVSLARNSEETEVLCFISVKDVETCETLMNGWISNLSHVPLSQVQLTLLTAIVKLFLKKPSETQELVQQVLSLATQVSQGSQWSRALQTLCWPAVCLPSARPGSFAVDQIQGFPSLPERLYLKSALCLLPSGICFLLLSSCFIWIPSPFTH